MQDQDWKMIISLHETNSITKAADKLYISQPSLSRRIQVIEAELGVRLLRRSHSGSLFTDEGEVIYKTAVEIVGLVDKMKAELAKYDNGLKGALKIGAPYTFTIDFLPEVLRVFYEKYPEVNIEISVYDSDVLLSDLKDRRLDVCFIVGGEPEQGIELVPIREDGLFVVYNSPIELEDLAKLQLITFSKNDFLRSQIDKWWSENFSGPRRIKFRVTSGQACISMIKQGLGYGFFSDRLYFENQEGLFVLPLKTKDGQLITNHTYLAYLDKAKEQPIVKNFAEAVKSLRPIP